jgi:soluble lytic murein transglycosylase-like protein
MMPGTAQELGINPFDTGENIMGSVRYMAQLLNKYNGDRAKAAAAYNWGMGNVDKDISEHHADWLAFAPRETKRYVAGLSSGIASAGGPRVYSPAPAREVAITVNNNTGGSAVITASQAAAGP